MAPIADLEIGERAFDSTLIRATGASRLRPLPLYGLPRRFLLPS